MTPNSLAFRLVAGAAIWGGLALLLGGIALASIFRDVVQRNFDNRLMVVWESLVTVAELTPERNLSVPPLSDPRFGQTFSGWYWQISLVEAVGSNTAIVNRSRSLWDQTLTAHPDVNPRTFVKWRAGGPEQQMLRIIAREVVLPGAGQPFLIIIAADEDAVTANIERFNSILTWSFAAFGVVLLIAMLIQVRVGLRPLRHIRSGLAAIRNGRSERLDGDFPTEIAPLVGELNALIEHNAEVLERSRTQVGNLAHALKTPLSILANEGQNHPGPLAGSVLKQTQLMKNYVDHYLARARAAATAQVLGARTDVASVLSDLVRTLQKIHQDRALSIDWQSQDQLAFRGERQDLEEMVGNLLDNACKWTTRQVKVSARSLPSEDDAAGDTAQLTIVIEDDGPGLSNEHKEAALERGTRLDDTTPGSGLGLSIVRDLVGLYGGTLDLGSSDAGGLSARLILPEQRGDT